jgi:hypothetical protein
MAAETRHDYRYDDLHQLINQLTEDQVDEVRSFMLGLVRQRAPAEQPDVLVGGRLSFIGSLTAEPDLAERSEEILEEIARRNANGHS